MKSVKDMPDLVQLLLNLLYHLSAILFYISDHILCLSDLKLIAKKKAYFDRNFKFFFLHNLIGILKNIFNMSISTFKSQSRNGEKT